MYHQLGSGPIPDEVVALRGAVEQASAGGKTLTVGLDALSALEAQVLNGLIAGLRRLRNAGVSLRLHVTRRELLKTLDVTGLDRVFEIVAQPDEPVPDAVAVDKRPSTRRRKTGGLADGIIAVIVACPRGRGRVPGRGRNRRARRIRVADPAAGRQPRHRARSRPEFVSSSRRRADAYGNSILESDARRDDVF